jgi:ABC-type transporter lipoprotein component MlaA
MLEMQDYTRKELKIEAVQVTEENFEELRALCGGKLGKSGNDGANFIQVPVVNPIKPRHARAFIGDWVTHSKTDGSWKVYLSTAFASSFSPDRIQRNNVFEDSSS